MTADWITQFLELARKLQELRGPVFVALVLRESVAGVASTSDPGITERWDLWIGPEWWSGDPVEDLHLVYKLMRSIVGKDAVFRISRVVKRAAGDPGIKRLKRHVLPGLEITRIANPPLILGLPGVREAVVFTPQSGEDS